MCIQLIGKIRVEFSPESILDEDVRVTAVPFVLDDPRRIAPDQRFASGALAQSPVMEPWQRGEKLRAVFLCNSSRRHVEPLQPLGSPQYVDEVVGACEFQLGSDPRRRMNGDGNELNLAGS